MYNLSDAAEKDLNMKSYLWSEKGSVWMEGAEKEQDLTATLNLGSDLGS